MKHKRKQTGRIPCRHGGARKGAGRKPTGRTVKTGSINLTPEHWVEVVDRIERIASFAETLD